MHIEKLIAAQNRHAAQSVPALSKPTNEVHQPIDPLTRLQADFAKRFGRPEQGKKKP
jgi:hypothetical protein